MADMPAVQSRLFTMSAAFSPSKDRNGSIWVRSRVTQFAMVSGSFRVRSAVGRGSPICPVAPPTSASGRFPASWSRRTVSTWTRCPTCSEAAVGSKPQ